MNPNHDLPIRKSLVEGDYRLTRTHEGIKVEVLDYHAGPLLITDDLLMKLRAWDADPSGSASPEDRHRG